MGRRFLKMPDGTLKEYESSFNFDTKFALETLGDYAEWDGYITPEGFFYPTKPSGTDYWNGSFNCHADFADDYIYCILGIEDIYTVTRELSEELETKDEFSWGIRDAKDYVVEYLGWVSIGHSNMTGEVYTCIPHKENFGHEANEKQKQIAMKIYEANNYDMKDYFWKFDGISPIGDLAKEETSTVNTEIDPTIEY